MTIPTQNKKCSRAALAIVVGMSTASMAQTTDAPPEGSMQETPGDGPQCPGFVRGAKLKVNEVDQGVRITITAGQPGYVAPLRNMTREVAQFVEQHDQTDPTNTQPETAAFPPVDIQVKDVTSGAQVTVKADRRADLAQVRQQAKDVERLFSSSQCVTGTQISRGEI